MLHLRSILSTASMTSVCAISFLACSAADPATEPTVSVGSTSEAITTTCNPTAQCCFYGGAWASSPSTSGAPTYNFEQGLKAFHCDTPRVVGFNTNGTPQEPGTWWFVSNCPNNASVTNWVHSWSTVSPVDARLYTGPSPCVEHKPNNVNVLFDPNCTGCGVRPM
jgi:hypothetical protein